RRRDHARGDRGLKRDLELAEAVLAVDLAAALPAQHDRGLEDDRPHLGSGADLQIRLTGDSQLLPLVVDAVGRLGTEAYELLAEVVVDGQEEVLLAGEVVIQRPLRDARPLADLIQARRRVALPGEAAARGSQQCPARIGGMNRPS